MWTLPEKLAAWWGPRDFTNPVCRLDPRPGGELRIDMKAPDGTIYPCYGQVREVVAPERLVFTSGLGTNRDDLSFEVLCSATFVEQESKTLLTLQLKVLGVADPASAHHLEGLEAGWMQSLDRLAEALSRTP